MERRLKEDGFASCSVRIVPAEETIVIIEREKGFLSSKLTETMSTETTGEKLHYVKVDVCW